MFGLFNKTTKPAPWAATETKPADPTMFRPQSPIELKIKACSLAAEARIIRKIELRLKRRQSASGKERPGLRDARSADQFFKLQDHRRIEIRSEARATHLARTFLKGQDYSIAEQSPSSYPNFAKISAMVTKYAVGDKRVVAQRFEEWKQKAMNHSLRSQMKGG